MEKFIIGYGLLGFLLLFIFGVLFSFPIMWLWNWLIPTIFDLTKINVFQAWGLLMLSGILFRAKVTTYDKNKK